MANFAGYHATTPAKLARYMATGAILPPVRFWVSERSARAWANRVGRTVILRLRVTGPHYPLPDHFPPMSAHWSPCLVRAWDELPPAGAGEVPK